MRWHHVGDWHFLQISNHEARHIVNKRRRLSVGKSFGGTHDGRVGERFDCGYTHECGEVRIGNIELISMRLEVSANKPVSLAFDGLDIFELTDTRRLLDQDTV